MGSGSEELHAQDHFSLQTDVPVLRTTDAALEMGLVGNTLLCKHEDPSLDPYRCNSSVILRGWTGESLRTCHLAPLA